MKKAIMILALLAIPLGGCSTVGALPSSPSAVANATVLDEQAMTAVELAYKAARIAVETGVDAGFIKGTAAAKVAALDNKAFAALGVVRGAYATGNAASYAAAIRSAKLAVSNFLALTGKAS